MKIKRLKRRNTNKTNKYRNRKHINPGEKQHETVLARQLLGSVQYVHGYKRAQSRSWSPWSLRESSRRDTRERLPNENARQHIMTPYTHPSAEVLN